MTPEPTTPSNSLAHYWDRARALALLAGLGAVFALAFAGLFRRPETPRPQHHQPARFQAPDFREVVTRIDQAFQADWQHHKLTPAPPADSLTVLRRLSLALTGTLPSLEEIRALETVPEPERVQYWLTYLFEDRRSSDYLAERFARAWVGVENGPFLVYRRRRMVDWLSDQLYANRPYDDLVRELISAEGLWTTKPAVNFVSVTVRQGDNKEEKGPDVTKLAGRTARAFLGVQLDCVQCHDDKMGDQWKQQDFHQLAAFYAGAEFGLTGLHEKGKPYQYRYLRQPEKEVVPPMVPWKPALIPADGPPRERLATWVTHIGNDAFGRAIVNRVWALLFNRALVEPVDNIPLTGPWPPGMEILAQDFIAHGHDLRRLIRLVAATRVFQQDSRFPLEAEPPTEKHEEHWAVFPLTRLRPEQVAGGVIQASTLRTIDADSHILTRLIRATQTGDFVKRHGDPGEEQFDPGSGTITQRLLLMNGGLVQDRTKENAVMNASTRIGIVAPDEETAVETSYLAILNRRPTAPEQAHFVALLQDKKGKERSAAMADLYWTLLNCTEFSWNH